MLISDTPGAQPCCQVLIKCHHLVNTQRTVKNTQEHLSSNHSSSAYNTESVGTHSVRVVISHQVVWVTREREYTLTLCMLWLPRSLQRRYTRHGASSTANQEFDSRRQVVLQSMRHDCRTSSEVIHPLLWLPSQVTSSAHSKTHRQLHKPTIVSLH